MDRWHLVAPLFWALLAAPAAAAMPTAAAPEPGQPSALTAARHARLLAELPFADQRDFDDAARGFIAPLPDGGRVAGPAGAPPAWDLGRWGFLDGDAAAPTTVNPGLWRQARLLLQTGLFKVADGIYQVRGADIANLTIVEGDTGLILIDVCTTAETARAALDLYLAHRPHRPVVALVYSHSHVDHYGGARGVVSEEEVRAGKVAIIAPEGFQREAVAENVLAGPAMGRRATLMFGMRLAPGPRGLVTNGLGIAVAGGTSALLPPTTSVTHTGQAITVDGVPLVFQLAKETEAPSEMLVHLPRHRALFVAEVVNATLHNLLTPRGALVRDALAWTHVIQESIELFGDSSDVILAPHDWPRWGADARRVLEGQRDAYRYIHDQALRLANLGLGPLDIAERLTLPPELGREWFNRGFYGTVKFNARAVYQRYFGFYDGHPAHLDPLPPAEAARRWVEALGGGALVRARAEKAVAAGEYRWAAELLTQAVFADPEDARARELQARAFEQLGYQAESGVWRNIYLSGAKELREGTPRDGTTLRSGGPGTLAALTPQQLFDVLAVRVDPRKVSGRDVAVDLAFPDRGERWRLRLARSVLVASRTPLAEAVRPGAEATLTLDFPRFLEVIGKQAKVPDLILSGKADLEGRGLALAEILLDLTDYPFWFPILTPPPTG